MTAMILALAVDQRIHVVQVALLMGAIHVPIFTGTIVLGIVAVTAFTDSRRGGIDPMIGVVVEAAGELRAGRPLRAVVASGAFGDELASMARRGLPIRAAGADALSMFGNDAPLLAAALDLATQSGGPIAATFDQLVVGMVEAERTRRERRAAMAPAIAQATIVGGVPSVLLVQMAFSGRWMELLAGGTASASVAVVGAVAVIAGVAWIVALIVGRR